VLAPPLLRRAAAQPAHAPLRAAAARAALLLLARVLLQARARQLVRPVELRLLLPLVLLHLRLKPRLPLLLRLLLRRVCALHHLQPLLLLRQELLHLLLLLQRQLRHLGGDCRRRFHLAGVCCPAPLLLPLPARPLAYLPVLALLAVPALPCLPVCWQRRPGRRPNSRARIASRVSQILFTRQPPVPAPAGGSVQALAILIYSIPTTSRLTCLQFELN